MDERVIETLKADISALRAVAFHLARWQDGLAEVLSVLARGNPEAEAMLDRIDREVNEA